MAVLWRRIRTFLLEPEPVKKLGLRAVTCDLKVLWWQSYDNSYNSIQMLTIFTQIERKNMCTLKKLNFYLNLNKNLFSSGAGAGRMGRNRVKIGPAPQHWYLGICTSTYKILLIDLSYRRFTRRSLNTNRYLKMLCIALLVLHLKGQCHAIFCPLIFLFKTLPVR